MFQYRDPPHYDPLYLQDKLSGVVGYANRSGGFDAYDAEALLAVGDQAGTVLQNARLRAKLKLRASYLRTVDVLADTVEVRDPFLRGHSEEVVGYVAAVAKTPLWRLAYRAGGDRRAQPARGLHRWRSGYSRAVAQAVQRTVARHGWAAC